ncbi:hypothetical protein ACIBM4_05865 [Streptomyces sp. NPDC050256]|uniref:hypothetical protein n=1 Tax=Streptomyces sp. NPDC050256 TaxID=3365607 RepID=UPI0037A37045
MIGPVSLSPTHRRVRSSGVLAVLIWVSFHLLGCMHGHGPAFGSQHHTLSTTPLASAPVASSHAVTASVPERAPCCPETGDHTVDRVRSDAPPPPALGGVLPTETRSNAPAALAGSGAARAPDQGGVGGRCILTALCVART